MAVTGHTIIIGAGPAGLTAAYELGKLGLRATVLEADGQMGGLSRTMTYKDYRFDIGGHRFFSKVKLINELWHEILGDKFLLRPRLSRIHYRNHYFDYPLKPLNALAGLGPVEALLVGMSYTKAKLFPAPDDASFEQWVSNRFGYRLYEIFFKTYTEKVWGMPCAEISADWAAQRIRNLSLSEALRAAVLKNSNGSVATLIDEFQYPQLGPGMMWDRCAELVHGMGSATQLNVRVERIRHQAGRVACVYGRTAAGESVAYGGDQFISSMPVRELIRALDPAPPDDVVRAAEALRYRDYLTVVLVVNRADVFPDNWIYIHTPDVKLGRIQNYKNWSPFMVPDQSRTSLGLEYFLWDRDPEWTWSQSQLMELGIRDCAQIGLIERDEIEDGTVLRVEKAYPVYDQQYQTNLARVRAYLAGLKNLQLIGRNGQHRYNNQDHSMLTGVFAARNIAGADYDVWSVNVEQEYHEEGPARGESVSGRDVPASIAVPELPVEVVVAAFARFDAVAAGVAVGTVSALVLLAATVALLIQGGLEMGKTLSLLSNYLWGYSVSWRGAFWGAAQFGVAGYVLGYTVASLRNLGVSAYATLLRRRAVAEATRNLLDEV